MKNGVLTAFLILLAGCSQEPQAVPEAAGPGVATVPDAQVHVFYNARIHTVDEARPTAAAMAFNSAGEILDVGDDSDIRARFPGATLRDLQGMTVIPGLIDAHAHLYGLAVSLSQAQLTGSTSKEEVIRRLLEHEQNLSPDDWLLGWGWDQNDWPVREFPNREDLDGLFPDRPVWLQRIDGHAGWANSAALAMADRDLGGGWQPEGGYIHRDGRGQATGVLIDQAQALIDRLVPPISESLLVESLDLATRRMVSLGLTGVHDMGVGRPVVELYQQRIEAGEFPTRVYAFTDGAGATLDWLCERGAIRHPSGRLVMRAVKLFADGALGSRGAALLADYSDDPGNAGLLFMDQQALQAQVDRAMSCGFQVGIHAIGDRANRESLDALQVTLARHPGNPGRHRVEHVQVLSAPDVPRFAELGVIAAMQPTHATSDMYWAEDRLGSERVRFAYAWRSLADSGARLALGSDFPVEAVDPLAGLYAAVTRQDLQGWPEGGWYPQERVTRAEALRGFTLDAAYAGFMEDRVGSLAKGKRADFVVLDRDIMRVPVAEIPRTRVLETWLDGILVYARAESE
jgi:predicted amidohydrolase YtcJ